MSFSLLFDWDDVVVDQACSAHEADKPGAAAHRAGSGAQGFTDRLAGSIGQSLIGFHVRHGPIAATLAHSEALIG
jgi:hypothetical protein